MELYVDPPPNVDADAEWAIVPTWIKRAIKLYRRCRMFNEIALPDAGGVLDQDELTVVTLEIIHGKYNEIMEERMNARLRQTQTRSGNVVESVNIGKNYSRRKRG